MVSGGTGGWMVLVDFRFSGRSSAQNPAEVSPARSPNSSAPSSVVMGRLQTPSLCPPDTPTEASGGGP